MIFRRVLQLKNRGFTLIEVMVVISLLAILSTFAFSSYTTAQKQGRDARRKSDLAQVKSALELYYSVNNNYPQTVPWGAGWTDGSGTYMRQMPIDPTPSTTTPYCYSPISNPATGYNLYANLENGNDKDALTPVIAACTSTYNFKVLSPF